MSSEEISAKTNAVINPVKGMNDILPGDVIYWQHLEASARAVFAEYGYGEIRTPIVEPTALFHRGLGLVTDIVEKEMYSFIDSLNGDALSLRPENTAGVVRANISHNLTYDGPLRLWYVGPMFRHERPQRGRYRQFHQIGAEALGFVGPDVDAELILLCRRLWRRLNLANLRLEVNSIGDGEERKAHRAALIAYLEQHHDVLDDDAKRRLLSNPLRILDSKNPVMQEMLNQAPQLLTFLGTDSRRHFDGFCQLLSDNGQAFTLNPRLVRGMDYYNRSVFEWVSDELGAQGTVCGGGRYDPLMAMMGGKPTPACGFAMGLERLIELLRAAAPLQAEPPDCYVVHSGDACTALALRYAESLRDVGVSVVVAGAVGAAMPSFKSQLKKADNSGASLALILGADECRSATVTVKALRQGGEQQSVAASILTPTVLGLLGQQQVS